MNDRPDIIIIGGGPGGYIAALRGAQLKKKIVLVEEDRIGGTCMNYGCIPTKYLLHQTKVFGEVAGTKNLDGPIDQIRLNWGKVQAGRRGVVERLVSGLEFLLGKGKVDVVKGTGRVKPDKTVSVQTEEGEKLFRAERIILAPGGRPASLPFLLPDGNRIITSTEALEFQEVPKSLVVVGAGAIGLEIASVYRRLGTEVTVLEILPAILPGSDRETAARLERVLRKQGLKVFTEMKIEEGRVDGDSVVIRGTSLRTSSPFEHRAEKVLVAAGREPNSDRLFDGPSFLDIDAAGCLRVDPRLETSGKGIFAIGDVIGGKLLAHKAYHDGVVAVENAAGLEKRIDYSALPMAVFTDPEFASVGLTQEEASERGVNVRAGIFPLQASGRALTMDSTDGLVKILADENDTVVGAHLLAPAASELLPLLTAAVSKGMTISDLTSLIYVHPSLSEAVGEAALKARNEALHLLNT